MGLDEHADLGTFFLRLGLGGYLLFAGAILLWNPSMQASIASVLSRTPLAAIGGPSQAVMIYLTLNILIGALIVMGLFTRFAALVLVVVSILKLSIVNWYLTPQLIGSLGLLYIGKEVVLLAAGISLFFTGCRMLGIDCIMME